MLSRLRLRRGPIQSRPCGWLIPRVQWQAASDIRGPMATPRTPGEFYCDLFSGSPDGTTPPTGRDFNSI